MTGGRTFSVVLVIALVASVGGVENEAAARTRRHRSAGRADPRSVEPPAAPATPRSPAAPTPTPGANKSVSCSCTSTSTCPQIGTISIPGHKSEPVYCNQLNGSENPGVSDRNAWYFQCTELANRWLVHGLGAPRINGNADQMCGNADSASYDVYRRGTVHEPVPGDLLVWEGGTYGHVGVVTSVSSSSIAFANQNYGQNGVQYPLLTTARTAGFFGSPRNSGGLRAKCIIHPKKLASAPPSSPVPIAPAAPAGPCDGVSSAHDGKYCGGSRQSGFGGGDASTLFTCRSGTTTSARCRGTCTMERVGRDDHCS